ncbi:alpha/beta hydrolase [Sinorhizobium garamanticum]|uniref:Alpha/beta hydrolase n=1 Tax=Sinorhizobium garamanticum TaxID=680247 RepID=A0ABY8D9T1_9HYPH|nr:alpha/beta hydrolase [Sinorhizobium garamanticum]WEX87649.1 alpha/beta hydrolase [Sinorhizobium garamanticum]
MDRSEFREHLFRVQDGLQLYARSYGDLRHGRIPVVCLPGLTRNSRDFHELAGFLASPPGGGHFILSLDSRGRGGSERDDDKTRYTIAAETADLIAACGHFGIEKATFIGTSRGGLILHHLIGLAPALIAGVILNDIGPVIEIQGLLRIRDYLNATTRPASWTAAPRYLQSVHGDDFPILREHDWREMAQAIYRDEGGIPVADFDPAIAAQLQALTADTPLPDLWPQFDAFAGLPMMVVRGERSRLLSEATVEKMKRRHPNLAAVTAVGQGHAPLLHLDGPRQAIAAFLQQ